MSLLWLEYRKTMNLAIPIIMGQLGQMILQFVDTAMLGRVSAEALAASAFGSTLFSALMLVGVGLCAAVHVLVAQSLGAGQGQVSSHYLRHGLWLALAYSLGWALLIHFHIDELAIFRQPPIVNELAGPYIVYLGWSLLPILIGQCFKNYAEAKNRPWMPFNAFIIGIIINIFLNWVFIFGKLGAPEMGTAGAGLATLIARSIITFITIALIFKDPYYDIHWTLRSLFQVRWTLMGKMLVIGGPSAIQVLFDAGMFGLITLMMGFISVDALAAHQVALNYGAVVFMVALGLSFAASIRISEAYGARNYPAVWLIGKSTLLYSGIGLLLCAIATYTCRHFLPLLFTNDQQVVALAVKLLVFAAAFELFDGLQAISVGMLRGLTDVKIPTIIVFSCYWIVCAGFAYFTAFVLGWGVFGVWGSLVLGLVLNGITLTYRFYLIAQRLLQTHPQD